MNIKAFHPSLADRRVKHSKQEKSGRAASCFECLDEGTRRAVWFEIIWFWGALLSFFLGHARKDTLHGNATYA